VKDNAMGQVDGLLWLVSIAMDQGQWEPAVALGERAVALARGTARPNFMAHGLLGLHLASQMCGRVWSGEPPLVVADLSAVGQVDHALLEAVRVGSPTAELAEAIEGLGEVDLVRVLAEARRGDRRALCASRVAGSIASRLHARCWIDVFDAR
jgi:hypothetical protein